MLNAASRSRTRQPQAIDRIRKATALQHSALDKDIGQELMHGRATKAQYLRFLLAHLSLHQQVASLIGDISVRFGSDIDWSADVRSQALQADLKRLNHNFTTPAPANHINVHKMGEAYLVGLIYVVEGSALGNTQMLNVLNRQPGFTDWQASEFLRTSRNGVRKRWPATLQLIEQRATDVEELVRGATDGFSHFHEVWHQTPNSHKLGSSTTTQEQ